MVGLADSPICVAHADMILTSSKVKVTDLKFRKLHFSTFLFLACNLKLMVDYTTVWDLVRLVYCVQLFRARFLNFSPGWPSRDLEFAKC